MLGYLVSLITAIALFVPLNADAVPVALAAIAATSISAGVIIFNANLFLLALGAQFLAGKLSKASQPNLNQAIQDRQQTVRSNVEPRKTVYGYGVLSGPLIYVKRQQTYTSNGSQPTIFGKQNSMVNGPVDYLHLVVALTGSQISDLQGIWLNDDWIDKSQWDSGGNVNAGNYNGFVRVEWRDGNPSGNAWLSDLGNDSGGEWDSNHLCNGCSLVYVRLKYDANKFANGIPNIKARVQGKPVWNPSNGVWGWGNNWALVVLDYLRDSTFGLGVPDSEIDMNSFIAGMNLSSENVIQPDGTYDWRYYANGVIDWSQRPSDVMKDLLTAGAGTIVYTQGVYRLLPGAYSSPVNFINEDILRDSVQVKARQPRQNLFNAVRGTFIDISPQGNWQPNNFPEITNATFESQDGGVRIYQDIQLPFTTNNYMAQRIAKIHLMLSRSQIEAVLPCNMNAFQFCVGDNIQVNIKELGWSNKEFLITDWKLNPEGGVDLTIKEINSQAYSWSAADGVVAYTPSATTLPSAFSVAAPSNLEADQTVFQLKGTVRCFWQANDATVNRYQVEWSTDNWTTAHAVPVTGEISVDIPNLDAGNYQFRVKAQNQVGAWSGYSNVYSLTVQATNIANPTGLVLAGTTSNATTFTGPDALFNWTDVSDANKKDYKVQILDASNNVLRTEYVAEPSYTYTFSKNKQDNNGSPKRSFTIKVWTHTLSDTLSTSFASLSVSNPQCAAVTGLAATASLGQIKLTWTNPSDPDFAGLIIYSSTSTGFTPSGSNLLWTGNANTLTIPFSDYVKHYFRVATYDVFDQLNMNLAAEVNATANQIGNPDLAQNSVATANIQQNAINDTKFATGIKPVYIGTTAQMPAAAGQGRTYFNTDDNTIYREGASSWTNTTNANLIVGTLTAGQIAAGAIGTQQLAVGLGGNLIYNAGFDMDLDGWAYSATTTNTNFARNLNSTWMLANTTNGTAYIHQNDGTGTGDSQVSCNSFPVNPAKYYMASAYTGAHRCQGLIRFNWYDANGNFLSQSSNTGAYTKNNQELQGGTTLAGYKRIYTDPVQPPSNAVSAQMVLEKQPTIQGQGYTDSYLFFTRTMVEEANQYQAGPSPWTPEGMTLISGNRIKTGSLAADRISAGTIGSQTIYLGDNTFRLDGTNKCLIVNDGTYNRVTLGLIGPGNYGINILDSSGNIVMNSGGAVWAYVNGSGKPANNADVTSANTAAGIANQGSLATKNTADFGTDVSGTTKPQNNADVTSSHTAAGISGQGSLATLNSADFATQVGGAQKPANNADVTSANTAAGIANQGSLATMSKIPDTTQGTPSTYIGNLAVGSLHIQGNAVSSFIDYVTLANQQFSYIASAVGAAVQYTTASPLPAQSGCYILLHLFFEWGTSTSIKNMKISVYRSRDTNAGVSAGDLLVMATDTYTNTIDPVSLTTGDGNVGTVNWGNTNVYYKVRITYDNATSTAGTFNLHNYCLDAFFLLK